VIARDDKPVDCQHKVVRLHPPSPTADGPHNKKKWEG
jgi:hypothetical protein